MKIRKLSVVPAIVVAFALSGCGRSQSEVALENALIVEKALRSDLEVTKAKLAQTKAQLESREQELARVTASPEYELWKIRADEHTPRERLKLLQTFAGKYPKSEMATAANQAFTSTANALGDAGDELLKQRKYDEATKLMTGVSDGLPQLAEFESRWLEKIRGLAEYDSRLATAAKFQERFKAGQVPIEETIRLIRGKSPNDVISLLGRPDSTSLATLGKQFTYWTGAFNADTGKGDTLVIAFADAPINKVLSVKSSSSPAYVDEDVRRQVNAYLSK